MKRQAELQAIRDAWDAPDADHGKRRGPFDGVPLTEADVAWFAEQVRDADSLVSNLHLEGASVREAYLLGREHLEGAFLYQAHLETLYVNT